MLRSVMMLPPGGAGRRRGRRGSLRRPPPVSEPPHFGAIGRMAETGRAGQNRSPMKCLLVDDHALVRDALALLIAVEHPGVDLRHAGRLREALAALQREPDVELVLLDLALPDSEGLATLAALRHAAPVARTVILSADDRPETVLAAIEAGAAGFIPKATESRQLRLALGTVLGGGVYVPATTLAQQPPPANQPASAERLGLTPRQAEVLWMLIGGHSNKRIARSLALSPSTVKSHLEAIFERLQVNSRTQAVVAAARLGLRL
ncbi:MAG: response regulator transcription factor [Burkholderiales bacterium]|nr:response regulator transcription factor [Burkholderiales bacterium]